MLDPPLISKLLYCVIWEDSEKQERQLVETGVAENYNPILINPAFIYFFYNCPPVIHDRYPNNQIYRLSSGNLNYCQEKHPE